MMIAKLLKADEVKVALIAAISLIIQAIVRKKILHTNVDSLFTISPAYLFIIFIITKNPILKNDTINNGWGDPLYWSIAIITTTVITVLVNNV